MNFQPYRSLHPIAGVSPGLSSFLLESRDGYYLSQFDFGHPPCFLPLWSVFGDVVYGLWSHWPLGRDGTFVFLCNESVSISEAARNCNQLCQLIILELIEVNEGVNDEVSAFANQLQFSGADLQLISCFWEKNGDDFGQFLRENNEPSELPRSAVRQPSDYQGSMPVEPITNGRIERCSSFELEFDLNSLQLDVPVWLRENGLTGGYNHQVERFKKLMSEGEILDAWFCLCSSGWTVADAVRALQTCSELLGNEILSSYCDIYTRSNAESDAVY